MTEAKVRVFCINDSNRIIQMAAKCQTSFPHLQYLTDEREYSYMVLRLVSVQHVNVSYNQK